MADIIHLLPDSLANQIAAGEVVQRPASVVKELLENSVDAGAKHITLVVKDAGKGLLQVVDDGAGMSPTDARMSLERHATSKLHTTEDLFTIRTKGFRGEALASIAAVSQLEMKTRQAEAELGTLLAVEASAVKRQEPTNSPVGTSLSVKNLFFNVPARRNFLKSDPVELKHILEEFTRVALPHPEISFRCEVDGKRQYELPAGKLVQRIVGLFGDNYRGQLVPTNEDSHVVKVHGFIGKPDRARKQRGDQYFFVNQRFVKNSYLHHAVSLAFQKLLPEGHHPFYVLFLEMDPKQVDINVHPTKTEVKFEDDRLLHGVLRSATARALAQHHVAPPLDFDDPVEVDLLTQRTQHEATSLRSGNKQSYASPSPAGSFPEKKQDYWRQLFEGQPAPDTVQETIFRSKAVPGRTSQEASQETGPSPCPMQLHQAYILTQVHSGLMVIDQSRAHERILYDRFVKDREQGGSLAQQLLFPQVVQLRPADLVLMEELQDELASLGFQLEKQSNDTVRVNGVPSLLADRPLQPLLEGLLEQVNQQRSSLSLDLGELAAASLAKRAALKSGRRLTEEEMVSLIDQLFATANPNYTPDGKSTCFIWSLESIGDALNR